MPERSNGATKQPHVSREQLQRRIDELSVQLVESERALSAAKRERDEHKISAAGASVSELEAQKSRAELVKDKEALHDALQVRRHLTQGFPKFRSLVSSVNLSSKTRHSEELGLDAFFRK